MEQIEYQDPPPDWEEVIIHWNEILEPPRYPIRQILAWVEEYPGGRYHLHGHEAVNGFAFRFERPKDATLFKLRWL